MSLRLRKSISVKKGFSGAGNNFVTASGFLDASSNAVTASGKNLSAFWKNVEHEIRFCSDKI